ncbi:protein kinase domain-containing protein [Sinimarinibacterium sp. CAU 1509]|uniref:protein kinase domain-containing protein n=1 Tax=Sinimarinibacterium sp. CAU 1509 TaxID=2562283 RepID=UPI00146B04B0|nr:winged helix-turn-helix domain-containing protein [Sinimarinibacterium sp. CAU 1509]
MGDQGDGETSADQRSVFVWRFSEAEYDERNGRLSVGGQEREMERRPLEVLAYLLRHAGEAVTKDELLEAAWPGMVTVDAVLTNAVAKLRKALGDENQQIIVTLHRVGYRLMGPVHRKLIAVQPQSLNLNEGQPVPGRDNFKLRRRLDLSRNSEVWLAEHGKTRERRVFKFSPDGLRLSALKREATLSRVLQDALGQDPAFVRVIDWQFDSAPYFLECEYGGENWLDWAEAQGGLLQVAMTLRLDLMAQLCDAIAKAHSAGVLHKDIKPANTLIDSAGGGPVVRVTDFGAGRVDPERLQELGITQMGFTQTQAVNAATSTGTPLYMAPEVIAGQAPTTQSDVYSLGVMLYQMVVGDLRRPMAPGWERDVDDPLLQEDIRDAAQGHAAQRIATAQDLAQRLRGLETRRVQRNVTLEAEARAVAAERALERARARRPYLWAAIAILAVGVGTTGYFYLRADEALKDAQHQYRISQAVNQFMNHELIALGNPKRGGNAEITLRDALAGSVESIPKRFSSEPGVEVSVRNMMGFVFDTLADYDRGLEQFEKSLTLAEREFGVSSPEALASWSGKMNILARTDNAQARRLLTDAASRFSDIRAMPLASQWQWAQTNGLVAFFAYDWPTAEFWTQKAADLVMRLPDYPQEEVWNAKLRWAEAAGWNDHWDTAESTIGTVLKELDLAGRKQSTLGIQARRMLVRQYRKKGAYVEALKASAGLYEDAVSVFGAQHDYPLAMLNELGQVYLGLEDYPNAEKVFQQEYDARLQMQGRFARYSILALNNVAVAIESDGRPDRAAALLDQELSAAWDSAQPDQRHPTFHLAAYNAARLWALSGNSKRAAFWLDRMDPEGYAASYRASGTEGRIAYVRGLIYHLEGDNSSAKVEFQKAIDVLTADDPGDYRIEESRNLLEQL